MVRSEEKFMVNAANLKEFRERSSLSFAGLEERISLLYDDKIVPIKITKSVLHRIETKSLQTVPLSQIKALAFALSVDESSLIDRDFFAERQFDLVRVHEGSSFRDMLADVDKYKFRLSREPGELEAQQALEELLELMDSRYSYNQFQALPWMRYGFQYRRIIETLQKHGLFVHAGKSKQVAPFEVSGQGDTWEPNYTLVDGDEWREYPEWDGAGLCDVLLVRVSEIDGDFIPVTHRLNPGNIPIENDSFMLENIERLKSGTDEVSYTDFKSMELDEFLSSEARRIVELSAENIVNGSPEVGQPELTVNSKEKEETKDKKKKDGKV